MKYYGHTYDENQLYNIKPFAFDITEGRHTWLYKAHTYHTKVPPKALVHFIEHYTKPGDIILDGFAGSGMTAIAASMTEQPRTAFVSDLSPAASFITSSYLSEVNPMNYINEADRISKILDEELGWMYQFSNDDENSSSICNYFVWSDVFLCAACGNEIVFWNAAFDKSKKKFKDQFYCPHCNAENSKRSERAQETFYDHVLQKPWKRYKQIPVLAAVSTGKRRAIKKEIRKKDIELIDRIRSIPPPLSSKNISFKMLFRDGQWGDQWKNCLHLRPITHSHQLFSERQFHYISRFLELLDLSKAEHRALLFTATSILQKTSRLMVYNADGIGRVQKGTLYISSVWQEMRFSHMLKIAAQDMLRAAKEGMWTSFPEKRNKANTVCCNWTGSASSIPLPNNSIDYVFVDPPFGANIPYSELNFLWESFLRVFTDSSQDAIESPILNKTLFDYQKLMEESFSEYLRVLKPGRWITIEFHNSKNSVWNAIQEAISKAGFVIADVRILDKKQVSFKQATTIGAVKKDLVITAYKPKKSLEQKFKLDSGLEEGVWDFVREHLLQLPVFVSNSNKSEVLSERQDFMLFDRMVAFHVQRGVSIPLSATEFYLGLKKRFAERDRMFFLSEQVADYDKKRMKVSDVLQLQLYVTDESSAILWLKQQLDSKPQSFQDLHPKFLKEINGWNKNEIGLELSTLLEQNFLIYEGIGPVPEQIHRYLSTNWKDMRNLDKDASILKNKAKGRWYLPDPNRAVDLEKLRERTLLKDFEDYKEIKKKLKIFRIEAIRAGFRKAWKEKDYKTIILVAEKIPPKVLEEDSKLLMWYDQAITRLGGE